MRFDIIAAAAALLATACADQPVTTGSFRGGANPMFTYAAAGRDLQTIVVGRPFAASSQGETEAAALLAMQGRFRAQPTHLVLAPTATTRPDSRLMLAFDPQPGVSAAALCQAADPSRIALGANSASRLDALLAFCYRDIPYAEARGWVTRPNSPRDVGFTRLVGAMATELLPGADATMHDILDNNEN